MFSEIIINEGNRETNHKTQSLFFNLPTITATIFIKII